MSVGNRNFNNKTVKIYTIRLFPKAELPDREYPVWNMNSNQIFYQTTRGQKEINGVYSNELLPFVRLPPRQVRNQIKEIQEKGTNLKKLDMLEKEPQIIVNKLSEMSYYNYLGQQIQKNDAIKEIEKNIKDIQEECNEQLKPEWESLNAELALQHSILSGLTRMSRTNAEEIAKSTVKGGSKKKNKKNKKKTMRKIKKIKK